MSKTTQVVVMGARGRMGSTFIRLIKESTNLKLAAALERPGYDAELAGVCEHVGTSLDEILPKVKGAVIIDFTTVESSLKVAEAARRHGNPAVIGTTGFAKEDIDKLKELALDVPLVWAPNMSVGLNTLLTILPDLVKRLGPAYDLEVMEIHHNKKVDAPSGTAIKLGQTLAAARDVELDEVARYCRHGITGARPAGEIGLQTLRGGDVVGDHTVYFFGPGERIELTHRVHSRDTLAQGALRSAAWVVDKKPGKLYGMPDVLGCA